MLWGSVSLHREQQQKTMTAVALCKGKIVEKEWDGKNRRINGGRDHDVLIRIDANLENFIRRFDEHEIKDMQDFGKVEKRLSTLERAYWVAIGVLIVVQLIIKFA